MNLRIADSNVIIEVLIKSPKGNSKKEETKLLIARRLCYRREIAAIVCATIFQKPAECLRVREGSQ